MDINNEAIGKRKFNTSFNSDYLSDLQGDLRKELDKKIVELSENVRGKGKLPIPEIMLKRLETLRDYMQKYKSHLSPESLLEGYITEADTYLNSKINGKLLKAREIFAKVEEELAKIKLKEKWEERVNRVHAKLLFQEGKVNEAIGLIANSADNKTKSFWLSFLIESGRHEEAYDFVSNRKIEPEWACEAIVVLVIFGKIKEAEEIYQNIIDEFETLRKKNALANSSFKGDFYLEKLNLSIAHAFFVKALHLTGKDKSIPVMPIDLTAEGRKLCNKSLDYLRKFLPKVTQEQICEDYFAYEALIIEMSLYFLLGNLKQADETAIVLSRVEPIPLEAIDYIMKRADNFSKEDLELVIERIQKDYPDKTRAYISSAFLEAIFLGKKEEAWGDLEQAIKLVANQEEREEAARVIFDVGNATNELGKSFLMIESLLPGENATRKLLEIYRLEIAGAAPNEIKERLDEIEKIQLSPILSAEIKRLQAKFAIKENNLKLAKELLEDSFKLSFNPFVLKSLLEVTIMLQDDDQALQIVDKIEAFGLTDKKVLHIGAQAARNLGFYKKSASYWEKLYKLVPEKADVAFGLAEMLVMLDDSKRALTILNPFIQVDTKYDWKCLELFCFIQEAKQDYRSAFDRLEQFKDKLIDSPDFLMKYMELAHRVNEDQKADLALRQLKILKDEQKIPQTMMFKEISLEEIKQLMKQRRESMAKMNKAYQRHEIPRMMLCKQWNRSLYLDWAVRTQELSLKFYDSDIRINYTTYSTYGMFVKDSEGRKEIVPIEVPSEAKEIVIDYHALITLHRLCLLDKLSRRYKKIFYSSYLKLIWIEEQKSYSPHQKSQELTHTSLNEKLNLGKFKEMEASNLPEGENDNPENRNFRLAQFEKVPLIDAFTTANNINSFQGLNIIRLTQVADWLYAKGKIDENRFKRIKEIFKGGSDLIQNSRDLLNDSRGIIVDNTSLELLEREQLIDIISNLGLQIIIEKWTANFIRNQSLEINFGKKVGEWHSDLVKTIKYSKVFNEFTLTVKDEKHILKNYYDLAICATLDYSNKNKIYLLTDDGWSARNSKSFGTEALIEDLYKQNIISIEEYSTFFLKLCKWRYRFLLLRSDNAYNPVLKHLAKKYKDNPLGAELMMIIDYVRESLEDDGLPETIISPDLPLPFNVKYYLYWLNTWINLLGEIWQDDTFDESELKVFTTDIYQRAIPSLPKLNQDAIRKNLARIVDNVILQRLYYFAFIAKNSARLTNLFDITFKVFNLENSWQKELTIFLKTMGSLELNEKIQLVIGARILKAINIEKFKITDPELTTILKEKGVIKPIEQISDETRLAIEKLILRLQSNVRTDLPEIGPVILIPPTETEKGELVIPHDLIQSPSAKLRREALRQLLEHPWVTDFTRKELSKNIEAIVSEDLKAWSAAANLIYSDFLYTKLLFKNLFTGMPKLDNPEAQNNLIKSAWNNLLSPNVESILSQMPYMISADIKEEATVKELIDKAKKETKVDNIESILDWYLENVYFLPVDQLCAPSKIIPILFKENHIASFDLDQLKSWVDKNDDPLSFVMVLEILLMVRTRKDILTRYGEREFNDLLSYLLRNCFLEGKEPSNAREKFLLLIWNLRVKLARYYLKYIDLNLLEPEKLKEKSKIFLAWWLAREVVLTILSTRKNFDLERKIQWLERIITPSIKKAQNEIELRSIFDKEEILTSSRFVTLHGKFLIAAAAMATMTTQVSDNFQFVEGKEQVSFEPTLRDEMIRIMTLHTLLGFGQIEIKENIVLWDFPTCFTVPLFLKHYYGDALEFLGKDNIDLIKGAEDACKNDFVNDELLKFKGYIEQKQWAMVALVINSLDVFLSVKNSVPNNIRVISNINIFDAAANEFLQSYIYSYFQTINKLQARNEVELVKALSVNIQKIGFTNFSENIVDMIVMALISTILTGADYNLVRSLLQARITEKKVQNALGKVKLGLGNIFPLVQPQNRDLIRKLLNDLNDIPIPEEGEK